jgi:hypothetical protein
MKTLAIEVDRQQLMLRLQRLTPDSQRRWGKMSPHQIICHLSDSFKAGTGEKATEFIAWQPNQQNSR